MKEEYTIGEICKIYDLGPDSLRYYEKKGVIAPKRKENGYRSYTLDDIWRLNIVKDLRKLGFSIEQIKMYLEDRTLATTMELMKTEIQVIQQQLAPLIQLKEHLENKLIQLETLQQPCYLEEVRIEHFNRRKIILVDKKLSKEAEVDLAFRELESRDDRKLFLFANKDMGVFIAKEGMKKGEYTKYEKAFFFVEDEEDVYDQIIEEGLFATLVYKGSYTKSQVYFEKVVEEIRHQGYRPLEPAMEIYRVDIHGTSYEDEFITEIQIPVEKI